MQLTFVTDLGQSYAVDIDPDMELENVMALLEAEVGHSPLPSTYNLHISLLFSLRTPHFSPRTMTSSTFAALDPVKYTP